MPDERTHVAAAVHNQEVLDHLLREDSCCDWAAVVAFYKALHVVEAVFWRNHDGFHASSHGSRERLLKRNRRRYGEIYKRYAKLSRLSMIARYLESRTGPGPDKEKKAYSSFTQVMTAEEVRDIVVGAWLKELVERAKQFLSREERGRLSASSPS